MVHAYLTLYSLQISTSKPKVEKSVFLVLTQTGVLTVRRKQNEMGKVTRYSYVQIESAEKEKDPRLNKRQAQTNDQFTIRVNFYNKDLDASKKKVIKFKCHERAEDDDSDEEEMKSYERTQD